MNQQSQNQGQGQGQPRQNPSSTGFSAFDTKPPTNGGQQAAPSPFDWSMPPAPGAQMQGRPVAAPSSTAGFSDPWNLSSVPAPAQVLRSSPTRVPVAPVQTPGAGKIFLTASILNYP